MRTLQRSSLQRRTLINRCLHRRQQVNRLSANKQCGLAALSTSPFTCWLTPPLPMAGWLALLMAGWLAAVLTFYLDCQARRWTWRRPPPAIGWSGLLVVPAATSDTLAIGRRLHLARPPASEVGKSSPGLWEVEFRPEVAICRTEKRSTDSQKKLQSTSKGERFQKMIIFLLNVNIKVQIFAVGKFVFSQLHLFDKFVFLLRLYLCTCKTCA